jgi:signal transduction histidine kinase
VSIDTTAHVEADQLRERLRQSERMESVGQLAGGVAHDFNNLLAVITNFAEFVADGLPDGSPLADDVEQIRRASDRAAELTRRLLTFSRRQLVNPTRLHVPAVVRDAYRLLGRTIEEHVRVELDLGDDVPPACADRGELEQVIVNLVLNARDAMPDAPGLRVVFCSGYSEDRMPNDALGASSAFVEKPFTSRALLEGLAQVTGEEPPAP